jgi:hypothetical protein
MSEHDGAASLVRSDALFCDCRDFVEAQASCTDNEGYGPLFSVWDGKWSVGCSLPEPTFCPWCGRRIRPPQNASMKRGGGKNTGKGG